METQLEIDFVRWLSELSRDVTSRYHRWFENEAGDSDDDEYCVECVEAEQAERIAAGNKFNVIDGWNESSEKDSQPFCARCGCLLDCSPTKYHIRDEIMHLEGVTEMGASEAWCYHNWLSGMGCYSREEHWPKIKPHAERLMLAAGREVVPDGFITFVPASDDWYPFDSAWLGIYQWFASKFRDWKKEHPEADHDYLVDTSGRGGSEFQSVSEREKLHKCVYLLLKHVGQHSGRGQFLASIGLESHADLQKPIRIVDDRCDWPTFDVRGRRLNFSPNQYHPDAVILTHSVLQLSSYSMRWGYRIYYNDNHYESTSWCICLHQKQGQRLEDFFAYVAKWKEENLVPADRNDDWRLRRLQQWDKTRRSLNEICYFDSGSGNDVELTDMLTGIDGTSMTANRIKMTPRRVATLKRWIESSKSGT